MLASLIAAARLSSSPAAQAVISTLNLCLMALQACSAFRRLRDVMVTRAPSIAIMAAARCPTGPVPARMTAV